ncbi:uncharacterized protein LOC124254108 [Haliotis rubra]|uniref:uncharacterized protein LOC124254108 n=1 Tax=Haliotis rubra TaxID=36100 RepID=UPI001EE57240|nr:uncharacterized protein LOC124254108 [Haliotis rubra]
MSAALARSLLRIPCRLSKCDLSTIFTTSIQHTSLEAKVKAAELDYVKVFRRLLAILPREPEVKTVILDFELATWKALAKVLPAVRLRGCLFHLTQAVWRKCQEFGLQIAYQKDDAVHKFVRKLMALPFLPSEHIPRMFAKIADRVERHGPLNQLIIYFRRQWMEHQVFEPSTWSAYRVTIRTNNHVEGWHRRMNGKVGEQALGIYRLIPELHREAALLQIQTRLILEGRLRSYLRKAATARQEEIFAVWRMYKRTDLTLSQLLSRCAMIHGPVIQ